MPRHSASVVSKRLLDACSNLQPRSISRIHSASESPIGSSTIGSSPFIDFALSTPHLAAATTIGLLPIGDRAGFLCVRTVGTPTQVIAAVVTKRMESLVSAFFVDLLGSKGVAYGVRVLEQPPVFIANRSPQLLRRPFVVEGITAWMRWGERHGVDPWPVLKREVAERWGRDDWNDLSSEGRRRSLVRLYLAIAYVESSDRDAAAVMLEGAEAR